MREGGEPQYGPSMKTNTHPETKNTHADTTNPKHATPQTLFSFLMHEIRLGSGIHAIPVEHRGGGASHQIAVAAAHPPTMREKGGRRLADRRAKIRGTASRGRMSQGSPRRWGQRAPVPSTRRRAATKKNASGPNCAGPTIAEACGPTGGRARPLSGRAAGHTQGPAGPSLRGEAPPDERPLAGG